VRADPDADGRCDLSGFLAAAASWCAAALCRMQEAAVQLAGRSDLGRHPRRVLGDQRHMGPRDLLPRSARLVHRDRSLPRPERLATASPGPSGAGGVTMRTLLKVISIAGLGLTVVPSFL